MVEGGSVGAGVGDCDVFQGFAMISMTAPTMKNRIQKI